MDRAAVGLLGLDGFSVNANCSDLASFGERGGVGGGPPALVPAGVMDGRARELPSPWETRLKGADRRLSFTFAVGTNGGTWPLELHLFEHLAHFGSAVSFSSKSLPPPSPHPEKHCAECPFVCKQLCKVVAPHLFQAPLHDETDLPFIWRAFFFVP